MSDWTVETLKNLMSIKHGHAFKGKYFKDTPPGDILLTPGNFAIGGGFQFAKIKYYTGPSVPDYELKPNDLLVTMTDLSKAGDTLGFPALVPDDDRTYLHNQRLGLVELLTDEIDTLFFYWLMKTSDYRDEVLASHSGAVIKHTSPSRIVAYEFSLPPSIERKSIQKCLQSLEDKIELNRQMNEVLEGMARAVFRDWFVDFGPTRRKMAGEDDPVKILGGAIGNHPQAQKTAALFPDRLGENGLPEGWEETSIYGYAKVIYGAPFKSKQFNKDGRGRPLARIRDLPKNAGGQHTEEIHKKEHLINSGDIAVGMDGEFRAYIWHGEPTLMNQRVCSFVPISAENRAFVWLSIEPLLRFFEETAIATTVIHLGKGDIDTFEIIKSNGVIENAFSAIVEPLVEKMVANGKENQTLAEMRDLLLPKLMSGEISLGKGE